MFALGHQSPSQVQQSRPGGVQQEGPPKFTERTKCAATHIGCRCWVAGQAAGNQPQKRAERRGLDLDIPAAMSKLDKTILEAAGARLYLVVEVTGRQRGAEAAASSSSAVENAITFNAAFG